MPLLKTVSMPIIVPDGDHCWGKTKDGLWTTCDHFDNEGGHATCNLDFDPKRDKDNTVLKDKACKKLIDII